MWCDLLSMALPPLPPRLVDTLAVPSVAWLPCLRYGLSASMWSRFPIMRGGAESYMVRALCCWRAKAAMCPDGYIAWRPPAGTSGFSRDAVVHVGRVFARHIELRLAKEGDTRKYVSMPVTVLVPLAQFNNDRDRGAETPSIRPQPEPSSSAEAQLDQEHLEIIKQIRARSNDLVNALDITGAQQIEVLSTDSPSARVYSHRMSSSLFDDHPLCSFAGSGDDDEEAKQRKTLRRLLRNVSPFVPERAEELRRLGASELLARAADRLPALKIRLPGADNAEPGGAEALSAIMHVAASHGLQELRLVVTEIRESHGDNWCIEGDTQVDVIAHDLNGVPQLQSRRADALRAGDVVAVAGDVDRPARVILTIRSQIGAPLPMCWLGAPTGGSGVWITHDHPAWQARSDDAAGIAADAAALAEDSALTARWRPAERFASPVMRTVGTLHNFALDSGHVLRAGGVDIVTLAHGFSCKELAHPFWGTSACVHALHRAMGWPDVVLTASECRRLQALGSEIEDVVHETDGVESLEPRHDELVMPQLVQAH